jgi:hypothetical protein
MMVIPLQAAPNQTFAIQLDGSRFVLTIKDAGGVMCADVTRDDVLLVSGLRLVAGTPLLPYPFMERGNFAFVTEDDELPYYTAFGTTQALVYLTADELAELRGA